MDPLSLALAGMGQALNFMGASRARKAQKEISALDRKQLALSMEQNKLEAARQTRNAMRIAAVQRANAINAGANSGADVGSSSVQAGAGQAVNAGILQGNIIDQNLDYAQSVTDIKMRQSVLGQQIGDDMMMSQFGQMISNNAFKLSDIGQTAWGQMQPIGNWDTQVTRG